MPAYLPVAMYAWLVLNLSYENCLFRTNHSHYNYHSNEIVVLTLWFGIFDWYEYFEYEITGDYYSTKDKCVIATNKCWWWFSTIIFFCDNVTNIVGWIFVIWFRKTMKFLVSSGITREEGKFMLYVAVILTNNFSQHVIQHTSLSRHT